MMQKAEISKDSQMALLRQCAILLAKNKVCNEPSVIEWMKIVFAAHRLGYLYCGFNKQGNIDVACIAYRVSDVNASNRVDLPSEESGNTLYVTAIASRSDYKLKLLRLLNWYIKNNLEIKQVAWDYRNKNLLHIHKIRRN